MLPKSRALPLLVSFSLIAPILSGCSTQTPPSASKNLLADIPANVIEPTGFGMGEEHILDAQGQQKKADAAPAGTPRATNNFIFGDNVVASILMQNNCDAEDKEHIQKALRLAQDGQHPPFDIKPGTASSILSLIRHNNKKTSNPVEHPSSATDGISAIAEGGEMEALPENKWRLSIPYSPAKD